MSESFPSEIQQSLDSYWDTTPTEHHSQPADSTISQPQDYFHSQHNQHNQHNQRLVPSPLLHNNFSIQFSQRLGLSKQESNVWLRIVDCYRRYEVASMFESTLVANFGGSARQRQRGGEIGRMLEEGDFVRFVGVFVEKGLMRKEVRTGKYGGSIYTIANL